MNLEDYGLNENERREIARLMQFAQHDPMNLHDMWHMLDVVWNEYGCDSREPDSPNVSKFYAHPVWVLNGIFAENDALSMRNRNVIAAWVAQQDDVHRVMDYGGGFGTIARLIATATHDTHAVAIDIYEPYPSANAIARLSQFTNIQFVSKIEGEYDCMICTDVLEHVADPLALFWQMIEGVRVGGALLIANAFYPVIKCHLPQSFHFRNTFDAFAQQMGLDVIGALEGSHATIYRKARAVQPDWRAIRRQEAQSRWCYDTRAKLGQLKRRILSS
jgi:2-polyprenyl-3-methyl-5-hydroxy-6-metoxy-1,4-benzoquinol methylase